MVEAQKATQSRDRSPLQKGTELSSDSRDLRVLSFSNMEDITKGVRFGYIPITNIQINGENSERRTVYGLLRRSFRWRGNNHINNIQTSRRGKETISLHREQLRGTYRLDKEGLRRKKIFINKGKTPEITFLGNKWDSRCSETIIRDSTLLDSKEIRGKEGTILLPMESETESSFRLNAQPDRT